MGLVNLPFEIPNIRIENGEAACSAFDREVQTRQGNLVRSPKLTKPRNETAYLPSSSGCSRRAPLGGGRIQVSDIIKRIAARRLEISAAVPSLAQLLKYTLHCSALGTVAR
jgi:hypothetical protein